MPRGQQGRILRQHGLKNLEFLRFMMTFKYNTKPEVQSLDTFSCKTQHEIPWFFFESKYSPFAFRHSCLVDHRCWLQDSARGIIVNWTFQHTGRTANDTHTHTPSSLSIFYSYVCGIMFVIFGCIYIIKYLFKGIVVNLKPLLVEKRGETPKHCDCAKKKSIPVRGFKPSGKI